MGLRVSLQYVRRLTFQSVCSGTPSQSLCQDRRLYDGPEANGQANQCSDRHKGQVDPGLKTKDVKKPAVVWRVFLVQLVYCCQELQK